MVYDIPDEITTNNAMEAIAYLIASVIKEGILPDTFKMGKDGYTILEKMLDSIWDKNTEQRMTEIVVGYITGYAVGSKQISVKNGN